MPPVSCSRKKTTTFPFLSLWRCSVAHYSCGYFNVCGNSEEMLTLGTSLTTLLEKQNQGKHCGNLAQQIFKSFLFPCLSCAWAFLEKSLGETKEETWKYVGGILVSHCSGASPGLVCRQVSSTALPALHRCLSLTGMCLWAFMPTKSTSYETHLESQEFPNTTSFTRES